MPDPKALIASGLALVPVPRGSKGPTMVGWNRRDQVITDPTGGDMLQGLNVGLAHAYCTPTPTCALDIDHMTAASAWLAQHAINLDALRSASDAVGIDSGRPNKAKLLFRLPAGVAPLRTRKVKTADGAMMLEFRCATATGLTDQDILPPSLHPEGREYRWIGMGNPLNPPALPEALLTVWHLLLAGTKSPQPAAEDKEAMRRLLCSEEETPRAKARLVDQLRHINADCDYERYRDVVWAILGTGWQCAEAVARAWAMTAPERYEDGSFAKVVGSFDPTRQPRPTRGSIYYFARQGGWRE